MPVLVPVYTLFGQRPHRPAPLRPSSIGEEAEVSSRGMRDRRPVRVAQRPTSDRRVRSRHRREHVADETGDREERRSGRAALVEFRGHRFEKDAETVTDSEDHVEAAATISHARGESNFAGIGSEIISLACAL